MTVSSSTQGHPEDGKLLVQIATYNTNLQGNAGLPQDLVDWLAPTLKVSNFLARGKHAPDIVAVGFQELLPLHLGCKSLKPLSPSVTGVSDNGAYLGIYSLLLDVLKRCERVVGMMRSVGHFEEGN